MLFNQCFNQANWYITINRFGWVFWVFPILPKTFGNRRGKSHFDLSVRAVIGSASFFL